MGDRVDLLIPLNQDAMDRHLGLLTDGAACLYNSETIKPGIAAQGVQLCPLPVSKLADVTRNKVAQNTLAVGAGLSMMGIGFQALEQVLAEQFKKKGEAVVSENIGIARAGGAVGRVGVPQDEIIPASLPAFYNNVSVSGGPAPARAYIEELLPDILEGRIEPGRVFDRVVGLDDVPHGYRAMDEREAIKVMVEP